MNLKEKIEEYKDVLPYLFFGVCTTLVNVIGYWICAYLLKFGLMPSTIIAWFLAVLFAYITNRKWVFKSNAQSRSEIGREACYFFLCRLTTGVVDWGSMFLFVSILHLSDIFSKFVANIIVILLNYIASKWVIFKKREKE